MSQFEKCWWCDGTGRDRCTNEECGCCAANGFIWCTVCAGIGVLIEEDAPVCKACKGIGVVKCNFVSGKNNDTAISLTEEIMLTGIKLKDASHVACAIIANCLFDYNR